MVELERLIELPERYKDLYRHWELHTIRPRSSENEITINKTILNKMVVFSSERMKIWEKKEKRLVKPYSKDPILNKYKFCNIYRELDKQTVAFHSLLNPLRSNFELWLLNMLFCRLICNPKTIEAIGLLSFDNKNNEKVFLNLKNLPSPKYGNAYVFPISVIQKSEFPTREEFFCKYLPRIIPRVTNTITNFNKSSVVDALEKVLPVFGFNLKFHWTEVLIDVAYQFPEYIDLFKQFPIGPGSMPTMELLNGSEDPELVCLELQTRSINFPYLTYNKTSIYLSAENWEGIGCEFRKYTNLSNGKGRKRFYK